MMNTKSIDALVDDFAAATVGQAEAMKEGQVEVGNQHALAVNAAFDALCAEYGDHGREALTHLLTHERAEVRLRAAAFLLRYAHDRARAVLETEANGKGLLAFTAAQTLQRWKEGEWKLDPG